MTRRPARTALVVDDNPRWLKTLTRMLVNFGYSVSTSQTCAEALSQVKEGQVPPDLIITDIRLSGDESNIDGLHLLQKLSERGQLRASVVVTGYPSAKTRQIAERLGAIYLEKGSFTREDFWRELEEGRWKPSADPSPSLQFQSRLALAVIGLLGWKRFSYESSCCAH